MSDYSTTSGFGTADWLMRAVKKNPEGLLLLAAGCALLMRKGSSTGDSRTAEYRASSSREPKGPSTRDGDRTWEMPEGIARAADTARDYASEAGRTLSETADRSMSAARDYADGARRTIIEGSQRVAEETQSTIERIVREQPMAVAIAGLAAGAAVAAAFPATRIERETLGPAGQRLSEAVSDAGERLGEAASAAGERLMSVAEEKGLNAAGVKEVARDVADTFGKSFRGDQQDDDRTGQKKSVTSDVFEGSQSASTAMRSVGSTGAASSGSGVSQSGAGAMRPGPSGGSTQAPGKSGSQSSQTSESKTPPPRTKGG
jgi:hypothetical protein